MLSIMEDFRKALQQYADYEISMSKRGYKVGRKVERDWIQKFSWNQSPADVIRAMKTHEKMQRKIRRETREGVRENMKFISHGGGSRRKPRRSRRRSQRRSRRRRRRSRSRKRRSRSSI